jgi:hypothetical protein
MAREWPERFVYVCPASKANVTAFVPLVNAGASRIAKVIILVGANDESGKAQDDAQARLPRDALERVIKSFLNRNSASSTPVVIDDPRDPQDPEVWGRRLVDLVKDSNGLPVVYSVTGGTKPMTLGATMSGAPLHLVHAWGQEFDVAFLERDETTGILRRAELERHGEITLEDRLALNDFVETPEHRECRDKMQARFAEFKDRIEQFYALWLRHHVVRRELNDRTVHLKAGGRYQCGVVSATDSTEPFTKLMRIFSVEGVNEEAKTFRIEDPWVSQLLRGGWLEVLLFNRVAEIARKRNDVTMIWSVELRSRNPDGSLGKENFGEIDVALLVRGQLHVIEAKTGWFGDTTTAKKALDQAGRVKGRLLGPPGRYLVVNPGAARKDLDQFVADTEKPAQHAGVEFFLGPDAIENVMKEVTALLASSSLSP